MKIRDGFVSNSSSSSFVIAVKQSEPCEHCGRSDPDFLQLVEAMSDDYETEITARGREDVLANLAEQLRDVEISLSAQPEKLTDQWAQDRLKVYLRVRGESWRGWELAKIRISYHANMLQQTLEQAEATGAVQRLGSEG